MCVLVLSGVTIHSVVIILLYIETQQFVSILVLRENNADNAIFIFINFVGFLSTLSPFSICVVSHGIFMVIVTGFFPDTFAILDDDAKQNVFANANSTMGMGMDTWISKSIYKWKCNSTICQ